MTCKGSAVRVCVFLPLPGMTLGILLTVFSAQSVLLRFPLLRFLLLSLVLLVLLSTFKGGDENRQHVLPLSSAVSLILSCSGRYSLDFIGRH